MDIVEDFLEITKTDARLRLTVQSWAKVNVTALIKLLDVLRRRIPGKYLPNLAFTVDACSLKEEPQRAGGHWRGRPKERQVPWPKVLALAASPALEEGATDAKGVAW